MERHPVIDGLVANIEESLALHGLDAAPLADRVRIFQALTELVGLEPALELWAQYPPAVVNLAHGVSVELAQA